MKFAFIENRYKTIFWAAIAKELRSFGHRITWLVQNPVFSPDDESVFLAPFPRCTDLHTDLDSRSHGLHWARAGDRFINYFGGNDRHYYHYHLQIKKWLDDQTPDVVIGESTLFHEFLVIDECLSRGIPYLHPSTPGYPGGRFSVYAYATKEPLGESQDIPAEQECLAIAESIRRREKVPDYMTLPSGREPERNHPRPGSLKDRLTILRGYLQGERFNTPSPLKKWLLDRQTKKYLSTWEQLASAKAPPRGARFVLYPLQMQPEANIDVWGQKFRDQTKLISDLADNLQQGWHLLVKANPKAKYELSAELIDVLRRDARISPISLTDSMADALNRVDLVCTVTGTVAVECVLSSKPVVQLGPGIVDSGRGCTLLSETGRIRDVIQEIETNLFITASDADRIRLIQRLYKTTFPGMISDPANSPVVMTQQNIQTVARTILEVSEQCA
ncbi:glycosyltransferase family 1 protein [Pseudothauera nasutitermitis]|uniref:Glycosyltransferase family 1 protein n=1 Tax=Pseudothauera nasutitermitis TaxID=2565930 RepID=A0A4S4ATA4_9RHOO|nr:glycosyltransferase family 1 protein [Pseudothauera nasutitermitis]THF63117.1 glycosyltransferase family 1 protein [Pseudothauera nasutitermitis]